MSQNEAAGEPMGSNALLCDAVYLLQASGECYSCKRATPMFGVMALPPMREVGEDAPGDEDTCILREITTMPSELASSVQQICGELFRPDPSHTADLTYWMNHCEHCDAKQGDFFVHGPSGPFWPYDEAQMDEIQGTRIEGPFRFVEPNMSYSGAMVAWRNRKNGVGPIKRAPRSSRAKRA